MRERNRILRAAHRDVDLLDLVELQKRFRDCRARDGGLNGSPAGIRIRKNQHGGIRIQIGVLQFPFLRYGRKQPLFLRAAQIALHQLHKGKLRGIYGYVLRLKNLVGGIFSHAGTVKKGKSRLRAAGLRGGTCRQEEQRRKEKQNKLLHSISSSVSKLGKLTANRVPPPSRAKTPMVP